MERERCAVALAVRGCAEWKEALRGLAEAAGVATEAELIDLALVALAGRLASHGRSVPKIPPRVTEEGARQREARNRKAAERR